MTRSSAARRQRRLKQKSKRGRPAGSFTDLLKDSQRFTVATWWAFEPALGPHVAARLATVLIEEQRPLELAALEDLLVVVSGDYASGPGGSLDDHASGLAAKSRLVASRATERELAWLTRSSGALVALVEFLAEGNWRAAWRALELLRGAGWNPVIERVGRRIGGALRSNAAPFDEGRLQAAGRRLLAAMKAAKAAKTEPAQ